MRRAKIAEWKYSKDMPADEKVSAEVSAPGTCRLVTLTLVFVTDAGKLCSASALALSLSASCSRDGGPAQQE